MQARTANYHDSPQLGVSATKQRTILRFDNIHYQLGQYSSLPWNLVSAKLRLLIKGEVEDQGWQTDPEIAVHTLKNNFCTEKATWDCRDIADDGACVQWRMLPLPPTVKPDYNFEPVAVQTIENGDNGWLEFDVTDDIASFLDNSYLNAHSYIIKKVCEKEEGYLWFWSCEGGQCPELVITISRYCPETVPHTIISLTPL